MEEISGDMVKYPKKWSFKMAMPNTASLQKYLNEIHFIPYDRKIDIFETRLDSSISDKLIRIKGYNLLHADRTRNERGVCIYIRHCRSSSK